MPTVNFPILSLLHLFVSLSCCHHLCFADCKGEWVQKLTCTFKLCIHLLCLLVSADAMVQCFKVFTFQICLYPATENRLSCHSFPPKLFPLPPSLLYFLFNSVKLFDESLVELLDICV